MIAINARQLMQRLEDDLLRNFWFLFEIRVTQIILKNEVWREMKNKSQRIIVKSVQ